MGNLAERVSRTSMSSQTQSIFAASPIIGIVYDDGVVAVTSPHGTGVPLARQATPAAVGVSSASHEALGYEVKSLRGTFGQNQRTLDAVQARLSTFERSRTRMEVQLDLLIRMQQPVAKPTSAAQAPPIHLVRIPIRLMEANVKHVLCTQFAR